MRPKSSNLSIIIFIVCNIILVGMIAYAALLVYKEEKKRVEAEKHISATTSPESHLMTFDFSKRIASGSPLIFGGVHHPPLYQQDAWNKLQDVGVTMMRTDFNMENSLPAKITLNDYRTNQNNVQDPATWNVKYINEKRTIYKTATEKGMKTIGIISYIPMWLSYSFNYYGVPRDWDIYTDIVKKHYKLYRNNLDYVEIWNEPNLPAFLTGRNSGLTPQQAYQKMYEVAAQAIREVDEEAGDGKFVNIGGPTSYIPTDTSVLESILKSKESTALTSFISYHNYEHSKEPSDSPYKDVLRKYGIKDLPLFITEWNVTPQMKEPHPEILTDKAITYAGRKFISFLKMGVAGANYHSLKEVKENSPRGDEGYLAFYHWKDNHAILLPQSKTWRLLSKTLGLGLGKSTIVAAQVPDDSLFQAVGFTNNTGQQGAVIVNNSSDPELAELHFTNIPEREWVRVTTYEASQSQDGRTKRTEEILYVNKSELKKKIFLTQHSVTGVLITKDVGLIEKIKNSVNSI